MGTISILDFQAHHSRCCSHQAITEELSQGWQIDQRARPPETMGRMRADQNHGYKRLE